MDGRARAQVLAELQTLRDEFMSLYRLARWEDVHALPLGTRIDLLEYSWYGEGAPGIARQLASALLSADIASGLEPTLPSDGHRVMKLDRLIAGCHNEAWPECHEH